MASVVRSVLLNAGKVLITQALVNYKLFLPERFDIASAVDFIPEETDESVSGPVVFSGPKTLIQSRMVALDTAKYILTVPEAAGNFDIGNIMMFAKNDEDVVMPFAYVVLPTPYKKVISDPQLGEIPQGTVPIPGNRFVCNITIKHSIDGTNISVDVITPTFSSLGFYQDVANMPSPQLNPWNQFILHNDTRTNSPTFASKDKNDFYWGVPLWQNLRDPNFGVIDGGNSGDNYKTGPESYVTGNLYRTPDSEFSGYVGGGSYEDTDADFAGTLGGMEY